MGSVKKNWLKFFIGWVVCFAIRLLPFRPPNVEPILGTQMPFSKQYGALAGFVFAFVNIALFDIVTAKIGMWTWITALTYGVLGIASAFYFKKFKANALNYGIFAVIGTIFYDAITGLGIGPLLYGQPFMEALIGQIPFTAWHLAGNVTLAVFLSPTIHRWIISNEKIEFPYIINRVKRLV